MDPETMSNRASDFYTKEQQAIDFNAAMGLKVNEPLAQANQIIEKLQIELRSLYEALRIKDGEINVLKKDLDYAGKEVITAQNFVLQIAHRIKY